MKGFRFEKHFGSGFGYGKFWGAYASMETVNREWVSCDFAVRLGFYRWLTTLDVGKEWGSFAFGMAELVRSEKHPRKMYMAVLGHKATWSMKNRKLAISARKAKPPIEANRILFEGVRHGRALTDKKRLFSQADQMASGLIHDCGCLVIASGFACWGLGSGHVTEGLTIATGALSGLMLSPDLDLKNSIHPSRPLARWKALGLGWIWKEYSNIKHRTIWSHLPGLCTAIRTAYLGAHIFAVLLLLLALAMVYTSSFQTSLTIHYPIPLSEAERLFWLWFIGQICSDTGHWVLDKCPVKI